VADAGTSVQTAFGVPAFMTSHSHSLGDSTVTGSSIDSLRERAMQYVASLGHLQH